MSLCNFEAKKLNYIVSLIPISNRENQKRQMVGASGLEPLTFWV